MSRLVPQHISNGLPFSPRRSRLLKSPQQPSNSRKIPCQCHFLSSSIIKNNGSRSSSSRQCKFNFLQAHQNYSSIPIYPAATSLASLEFDPSLNDCCDADEPKSIYFHYPDLANDKVENWTSQKYAHLPLHPDLTLFEPINTTRDLTQENNLEDATLQLQSRIDTNLSARLVHLLQHDSDAAEQLKSEVVQSAIDLPANPHITSHCFDLLFCRHDVASYLEWLPLVAPCVLTQAGALDQSPPISTAEVHLNQLLKLAPNDHQAIMRFLEILIGKKCFSRYVSFATIRHLVQTHAPATTISMVEKIISMLQIQSFDLHLIKPSQDFLVLQLANQGHLSDALPLFYAQRSVSECASEGLKVHPMLYPVLADQLISKIKNNSPQASQQWVSELEKIISFWRMDHETSLQSWLTPEISDYLKSPKLPLTKKISKKYHKVFNKAVSANPQVCLEFSLDKLVHFTAYFRSLFSQNTHPKFVKAAQLANEIHQILPLPNSFADLRAKLAIKSDETDERSFKSFLVDPPASLLPMLGETIHQGIGVPATFRFDNRSDIAFLWAHSWMIFYHRSGQPHRAIEVFLEYFVPVGCDLNLIHQIRSGSHRSPSSQPAGSSITRPDEQKYQKLIHPTTGVLTVLYDAILSVCPPKMTTIVFESFLQTSYGPQAPASSLRSNKRSRPNLGSYRPFVKAFLRLKDVDGALKVLESMHVQLGQGKDKLALEDEGGWIDMLEWCAIHSPGPQPKNWDPSYQWGSQRRRKIHGWDGKMKEDLVYIVLNRFFASKGAGSPALPVHPAPGFLETAPSPPDDTPAQPGIPAAIQLSKIFTVRNQFVEEKLRFLDPIGTHSAVLTHMSTAFPSLKLLRKLRFGFYLARNSTGLKVANQLSSRYK